MGSASNVGSIHVNFKVIVFRFAHPPRPAECDMGKWAENRVVNARWHLGCKGDHIVQIRSPLVTGPFLLWWHLACKGDHVNETVLLVPA